MFKFLILIGLVLILVFSALNQESDTIIKNTTLKDLNISKTAVDYSEDFKTLGFSGQKKLVEDSQGNVYIAYRKKVNSYYEIFVSKLSKNADNNFQTIYSENVSRFSNKVNQRVPSISIDSKDNIYLVWYGTDSAKEENNRQIKYSSSQDGGKTWSKLVNVSFVEGFKKQNLWQEHPDILVGKNDKLFVVWEGKDKENNNQQIKFAKSKDGSSWTNWKNIQPGAGSQSRPTILQDKDGLIYVFMYSRKGQKEHQIWYSTSNDEGETWSKWENISKSNNDSRHLAAVVDNQNVIHIVWREYNPENKRTQIRYSQLNGRQWSSSKIISKSGTYQYFPQIGLDKNNKVYVVWWETSKRYEYPEEDPQEGNLYLSILQDQNFSPTQLISTKAYFPNIIQKSAIDGSYIIYSTKGKNFSINFTEIKL